ncbi:MAG: tetratricopeptide repeat protein [Nanoarchaeota archaeon]|nr:tetratricopeptide repeat protein [Nanoarchaeota archaeon]
MDLEDFLRKGEEHEQEAFRSDISKENKEIQLGLAAANFLSEIENNPSSTIGFIKLANTLLNLGNYNEALEYVDELIDFETMGGFAIHLRGTIYLHMKRYQDAVDDYTTVIDSNSEPVLACDAYTNRASALSELGMFDEALEDLTSAINLRPGNIDAYLVRGGIFNKSGKLRDAIADFEKAIKINPDNPVSYTHIGDTRNLLGESDEAVRNYKEVLKLVEDKPIEQRQAREYYCAIRAKRGLFSLGINLKDIGIHTDYESESLKREKLTQQQIDNMI